MPLAIIDVQMPATSGLDLVRKINADPAFSATRIILLTPFGKPISDDELTTVKIATCCAKPVRQSALFDSIVLALSGRSDPRESRDRLPRRKSEQPVGTRGERILLAEDNAVNQQVALKNLRKLGFAADLAVNGLEVLTTLESKQYDIILMDCQMPELDGYEVTREIRKREGNARRTWIIAMTANVMKGDREKCLAAGMDDYLSKPLRRAELVAALERVASAPAASPIDPDFLVSLAGQDISEFEELIELFTESAPASITDMRRAIEKSSATDLAMAAHTLKGSCSNMGGSPLQELCGQLEFLGRSNNVKGAADLVAAADKELERLIAALHSYQEQHVPIKNLSSGR